VYSLRLHCKSHEAELLSLQLWEAGTVAISEAYEGDGYELTAGFENDSLGASLLDQFASYAPEWREDPTDWEAIARRAWPGRKVGNLLYLAPPWSETTTPDGRIRLVHNPGQASGTGEHPCTQLALEALERTVFAGCKVLDVGTGSGILAIAATKLGAAIAMGVDPDEVAVQTAKGNFELNELRPVVAVGSADCISAAWSDVTVANISATVLLSVTDELIRVTRANGALILTGFPRAEAAALTRFFPTPQLRYLEDWACLITKPSLSASWPPF
jgi:ribosomal protein L11 methyltransferase